MTQSNRPNIYKQLQDDIKVTDTLLDVGYGCLWDLIDFENSEFKRLEGIDKNVSQPFMIYKKIKELKHSSELHKYFRSRFHLATADLKNHVFNTNQYSLIICNKVLHFYPDNEKLNYLDKFYHSLQEDGLLFIKINHHKNADNTDSSHMIEIKKNVFKNPIDDNDTRYLVDPYEFLQLVRAMYLLIERHVIIDDKTISFVIRK